MMENQANQGRTEPTVEQMTPRIIVQSDGYVLLLSEKLKERQVLGIVSEAAERGYQELLKDDGTAVDAVEAAIRILEDDDQFNAGYGSLLNRDGKVECDAMIMDGNTMETGAVIAGCNFKNPVALSRKIMDESQHCALTGEGAKEFAEEKGFPVYPPEELITKEATRIHTELASKDFKSNLDDLYAGESHDTVSAIAMDRKGHFACATSTGGIPGKMKGRVSDAPLVGCGGYANEHGAAASSGHGEAIIKMTLAREVVHHMENGETAQKSAEEAVKRMKATVKQGYGCATAIDKKGNFGLATNSAILIWASVEDGYLECGLKRRKQLEINQNS